MIMLLMKVLKGLLDLFPTLELDIPTIEPVNEVLNIFAWVRAFVPVSLIVTLLGLTALYYGFKVTFAFLKWIISVVLK